MKITMNENYEPVIDLSEEESLELKEIKKEIGYELDNYSLFVREDVNCDVSLHLKKDHSLSVLWNLRFQIITDPDYIDHYSNLIYRDKDGHWKVKDSPDFLFFASSYNLLGDTSRGVRVLKMIAKVKTIEWVIENDYKDIVDVRFITPSHKKYSEIFADYGYDLFLYLNNNYTNKNLGTKFSNIFHIMKGFSNGHIHCSGERYRSFLKEHLNVKISKIYSSINDHAQEKEIKAILNSQIKKNKYPVSLFS